jgi:hypothetical protein
MRRRRHMCYCGVALLAVVCGPSCVWCIKFACMLLLLWLCVCYTYTTALTASGYTSSFFGGLDRPAILATQEVCWCCCCSSSFLWCVWWLAMPHVLPFSIVCLFVFGGCFWGNVMCLIRFHDGKKPETQRRRNIMARKSKRDDCQKRRSPIVSCPILCHPSQIKNRNIHYIYLKNELLLIDVCLSFRHVEYI